MKLLSMIMNEKFLMDDEVVVDDHEWKSLMKLLSMIMNEKFLMDDEVVVDDHEWKSFWWMTEDNL